ncbi:hypothetical protein ADUPG1_011725, partial [Aduncisulcus paluster]
MNRTTELTTNIPNEAENGSKSGQFEATHPSTFPSSSADQRQKLLTIPVASSSFHDDKESIISHHPAKNSGDSSSHSHPSRIPVLGQNIQLSPNPLSKNPFLGPLTKEFKRIRESHKLKTYFKSFYKDSIGIGRWEDDEVRKFNVFISSPSHSWQNISQKQKSQFSNIVSAFRGEIEKDKHFFLCKSLITSPKPKDCKNPVLCGFGISIDDPSRITYPYFVPISGSSDEKVVITQESTHTITITVTRSFLSPFSLLSHSLLSESSILSVLSSLSLSSFYSEINENVHKLLAVHGRLKKPDPSSLSDLHKTEMLKYVLKCFPASSFLRSLKSISSYSSLTSPSSTSHPTCPFSLILPPMLLIPSALTASRVFFFRERIFLGVAKEANMAGEPPDGLSSKSPTSQIDRRRTSSLSVPQNSVSGNHSYPILIFEYVFPLASTREGTHPTAEQLSLLLAHLPSVVASDSAYVEIKLEEEEPDLSQRRQRHPSKQSDLFIETEKAPSTGHQGSVSMDDADVDDDPFVSDIDESVPAVCVCRVALVGGNMTQYLKRENDLKRQSSSSLRSSVDLQHLPGSIERETKESYIQEYASIIDFEGDKLEQRKRKMSIAKAAQPHPSSDYHVIKSDYHVIKGKDTKKVMFKPVSVPKSIDYFPAPQSQYTRESSEFTVGMEASNPQSGEITSVPDGTSSMHTPSQHSTQDVSQNVSQDFEHLSSTKHDTKPLTGMLRAVSKDDFISPISSIKSQMTPKRVPSLHVSDSLKSFLHTPIIEPSKSVRDDESSQQLEAGPEHRMISVSKPRKDQSSYRQQTLASGESSSHLARTLSPRSKNRTRKLKQFHMYENKKARDKKRQKVQKEKLNREIRDRERKDREKKEKIA